MKSIKVKINVPNSDRNLELELMPTLFVIKKRKVRARGKEYWSYYIHVRKEIIESLGEEIDDEIGALPILALIRPAKWYHLLNWEEIEDHAKERLPQKVKEELKALGFLQ